MHSAVPMHFKQPVNAAVQSPQHLASRRSSDALNSTCFCLSFDGGDSLHPGYGEWTVWPVGTGSPALPLPFATAPVFVGAPQLQEIAQVMRAVESVVALPAHREQVLASAPAIARLRTGGPPSVFFGHDCHITQD